MHVCVHTRTLCALCSRLFPPPLEHVWGCSHRSPNGPLGHEVLCPLKGRFPGRKPRLLAVLWSLERKCAVGRLWDKLSPGLDSPPLPSPDTRHLKGSDAPSPSSSCSGAVVGGCDREAQCSSERDGGRDLTPRPWGGLLHWRQETASLTRPGSFQKS